MPKTMPKLCPRPADPFIENDGAIGVRSRLLPKFMPKLSAGLEAVRDRRQPTRVALECGLSW
jgi:hypothetical protein